ncbi:MAG: DUF3325 family protein [Pseudomonadota bacterium]
MARGGAVCERLLQPRIMLVVISSLCLLYVACALLYQADERRAAFAQIKESKSMRYGLRSVAAILFLVSLMSMAPLQGWLRGVPIWLGMLSLAFVLGLFVAAQRPGWHAPSAMLAAGLGFVAFGGAML